MSNSHLNIINSSSCLQLVVIRSVSFFKNSGLSRTFCLQFTADQVSVFLIWLIYFSCLNLHPPSRMPPCSSMVPPAVPGRPHTLLHKLSAFHYSPSPSLLGKVLLLAQVTPPPKRPLSALVILVFSEQSLLSSLLIERFCVEQLSRYWDGHDRDIVFCLCVTAP